MVELPQLFDDLVRVETRLYNALNDRLRQACGITCSQYEFLTYLDGHPGARVGDLAVYFAVGVGATSKGIDRLGSAGWVARQANPADGRSSLLVLTPGGVALVGRARGAAAELLTELIGESPSDIEAAGKSLRVWRRSLEEKSIGKPVG